MDDFKQAVYDLTEFVVFVTNGVRFKVKDKTTNNFIKFMEQYKEDGCITVSLDGSGTSIYGNTYVNTLARVWHDKVHIELCLDFSVNSEVTVCEYQMAQLADYLTHYNIPKRRVDLACLLLRIDIVDQVYYYRDTGKFVPSQYEFVLDIFNRNKDEV